MYNLIQVGSTAASKVVRWPETLVRNVGKKAWVVVRHWKAKGLKFR